MLLTLAAYALLSVLATPLTLLALLLFSTNFTKWGLQLDSTVCMGTTAAKQLPYFAIFKLNQLLLRAAARVSGLANSDRQVKTKSRPYGSYSPALQTAPQADISLALLRSLYGSLSGLALAGGNTFHRPLTLSILQQGLSVSAPAMYSGSMLVSQHFLALNACQQASTQAVLLN
jgi:hypothetical protein